MSFKLHLIIISCIIIAVMLIWQVMNSGISISPQVTATKPQYSLLISHASWGLNCRNVTINSGLLPNAAGAGKNNLLREDNVLGAVAPLCNGKVRCDIVANESTLGKDPSPACADKVLEVEYRCFSYDRPWTAKSSTGKLSLTCEQPSK